MAAATTTTTTTTATHRSPPRPLPLLIYVSNATLTLHCTLAKRLQQFPLVAGRHSRAQPFAARVRKSRLLPNPCLMPQNASWRLCRRSTHMGHHSMRFEPQPWSCCYLCPLHSALAALSIHPFMGRVSPSVCSCRACAAPFNLSPTPRGRERGQRTICNTWQPLYKHGAD